MENLTGEIKNLIERQGDAFVEFRKSQENRLERLEETSRSFENFILKSTSPFAGESKGVLSENDAPSFEIELSGGKKVPLLGKKSSCTHFFQKTQNDDFSIGQYCKNVLLGQKATSSSATVPGYVSAQVIDNIRSESTAIKAGSGTIIIDGPTTMAKITGDPSVYEHTEGASDISESDISLSPVSLNPKALVALVPLSMELVADSPNLDSVLNQSLAAAFASKLDALSIAVMLADSDIPTSSSGQDPALWIETLEAIGEAMAADQPLPGSLICNASDFIARASELASTAGSWLGKPPALLKLNEYPTTGISAGTAIFGGFDFGFAIALRQELRLEIVRFGKAASASHVLVAHMRAAGVVLQPKRLFIQQKIVSP